MKEKQRPCIYYICEKNCELGREGTHKKYCQRCDHYTPDKRYKLNKKNIKREKLEKIKKREYNKGVKRYEI